MIGAGLATIPLASHAQAVIKMDVSSERTVGLGASYALDTPHGMQNYGAVMQYGFIKEIFSAPGGFRGMGNINLYGAISNTEIENKNTQSYGIGVALKFGVGWNNVLLTMSKGYLGVMNSDKICSFVDKYGAGVMWQTGNRTRLYCEFIFSDRHMGPLKEGVLPYKKSIEAGIIHTLYRKQNTK